jgi:hypothetical protein
MAKLSNPQLSVTTDPIQNRADVAASCDVELTEFEVNAIKLLDLKYTLECRVLNRDLQCEDTVLEYEPQMVAGELPMALSHCRLA